MDAAKAELASLEKLAADAAHDDSAGLNRVKDVLAVAVLSAKAWIALAENKDGEALTLLREAVAKEDQLACSEPADWFFPNRHLPEAVLFKSGNAADAEAVYRDDLGRHPNNGWSLYGLAIQQQFDVAWNNAGVKLAASAF